MTDLASWLLEQITEDERRARAAAPSPWTYSDVDSVAGGTLYDPTVNIASLFYDAPPYRGPIRRNVPSEEADATGVHIAAWHPARVLAECEAKRRIVQLHKPVSGFDNFADAISERKRGALVCEVCADPNGEYLGPVDPDGWPCPTLRLLALPYADRPGFREEWRP